MRHLTLPGFLILACCNVAFANDNGFAGVWTGWQCPSGEQPSSGRCANFVLELHQKQDKLCGSHMFATAGASQIDEGGAPSVVGTIASGTAQVTVESTGSRQISQVKAELRVANGKLEWKQLESSGSVNMLPKSMKLTRSKHGTLFHPVFEQQLKAVCTSTLNQNNTGNNAGNNNGANNGGTNSGNPNGNPPSQTVQPRPGA